MNKFYTLDEISEAIDLPKSTFRYWESRELISSHRNESSGYREYSPREFLDIGDIAFYRSLDISIEDIKNIYSLTPKEFETLITSKKKEILAKISHLQSTIKKLDLKNDCIEEYKLLKEEPYKLATPDIDFIFPYDFKNSEAAKLYFEDSYNFSIVFDDNNSSYVYGMNSPSREIEKNSTTLVNKEQISNKKFIRCLLKIYKENVVKTNLDDHLKELENKGFQIGELIFGRFLLSSIDEENDKIHFYKLWIEII